MQITVPHSLGRAAAAERLVQVAAREGLELEAAADGLGGTVAKSTPLGAVRGSFRVGEHQVEVQITGRPAFLPEGAVRRAIEGALTQALA